MTAEPVIAISAIEHHAYRPHQCAPIHVDGVWADNADRLAVGLITRRTIHLGHFMRAAGGAVYLNDDGRRTALAAYEAFKDNELTHRLLDRDVPRWALPTVQATLLARHLRGDLAAYPPFVLAA